MFAELDTIPVIGSGTNQLAGTREPITSSFTSQDQDLCNVCKISFVIPTCGLFNFSSNPNNSFCIWFNLHLYYRSTLDVQLHKKKFAPERRKIKPDPEKPGAGKWLRAMKPQVKKKGRRSAS